jgi:hypothetical protein
MCGGSEFLLSSNDSIVLSSLNVSSKRVELL